jgi:hypothetical protein
MQQRYQQWKQYQLRELASGGLHMQLTMRYTRVQKLETISLALTLVAC